jgi:hypothetical protein
MIRRNSATEVCKFCASTVIMYRCDCSRVVFEQAQWSRLWLPAVGFGALAADARRNFTFQGEEIGAADGGELVVSGAL